MTAFIQVNEVQNQVGKAGHIATSSKGYIGSTLARVVEANINAGLVVVSGATVGKTVKAPASAAEVRNLFEGVLIDPEFKNDTSAAADYLAGQQSSVLEEGYIWAQVEGSPAVGSKVYVRHTSDGGSNTVLGKVRADSDGTVVIDTTADAVEGVYSITLDNGVVQETFPYTTDGFATTAEIIAALVSAIDASANYSAAGTTEITVTRVAGTEIKVVELRAPTPETQLLWVVTDNQKAERIPSASFRSTFGLDSAGVRVAQIRLPAK